MICDECATDFFSENIFWIAAEPVIGAPVIDRFRAKSEAVLTIGEHPDGELIYKDGKTIMEEIIEFYSRLEEGEEEYDDMLWAIDNTLTELGISQEMEVQHILFSPSDLKILSEVFYLIEEILHRYSKVKAPVELYLKIANILNFVADKADIPAFSPKFREKVCQDIRREAEIYYDLAVDAAEGDIHPFLYKAKLLVEMGENQSAKKNLEKALKIDDESAQVKIEYVKILLEEKNFESAERLLNDLLDTEPENAMVWFLKAEELRKNGRWGGAIQFYDQAISRNQEMTEAYTKKARVLFDNQMVEEANEILDKALEIDSNFKPAWYWKAKVLHEMGRWGGAIQCLNEVLAIEPHMEDAWVLKGDILTERDLYEEALKAYEISLDIVPNLKEVIEKKKVCKEYIC